VSALKPVSVPSFSARLVLPFVRLLQRDPRIPRESLAELAAIDPDERLPISAVQELLAGALFLTGDEDLGLKAAREIVHGDYGALEYASRSAATWADSMNTIGRYMRLVNDALRISFHVEGERVLVQLDSTVPLARAATDFQSAAFHISSSYSWMPDFEPEYEVLFTHPRPGSTAEYERTFVGSRLRFDAEWNGFVFPSAYLALEPRSADPNLHTLVSRHAEAMLAELPKADSLTERVRDLLTRELAGGNATLRHVARAVSMSERTLTRHLEGEGTSFRDLLEDLRRRLALRYVRRSELPLSEIAFLLGFSQAAAFHRAFRRWTGQTPIEYRKSAPRGA
jgi:AraC-like DNA-binding protein